jgi:hypothetical protein
MCDARDVTPEQAARAVVDAGCKTVDDVWTAIVHAWWKHGMSLPLAPGQSAPPDAQTHVRHTIEDIHANALGSFLDDAQARMLRCLNDNRHGEVPRYLRDILKCVLDHDRSPVRNASAIFCMALVLRWCVDDDDATNALEESIRRIVMYDPENPYAV